MVEVLAEDGVIDLGHKAPFHEVFVLHHLLGIVDMAGGKAMLFRQFFNLLGALGPRPVGNELEDCFSVIILESREMVLESRVFGQLRSAHGRAQADELVRGRRGYSHVAAVGAVEGVGGADG